MLTASKKETIRAIVRVSSGNFLEMYDFMVFGYYARAIGRAFFPTGNEFASLMLSLMTFGVGFLMRPLGAVVLGAYTDHHGRRAGLMLSLGMMSIGIVSIACVPGYATIGMLAPMLVVMGRLLQGFSAGMELGGVSVYLSEIATPGHKGFYVSWQSGSQQVAVMFAALLGVVLSSMLSPAKDDCLGLAYPSAHRLRHRSSALYAWNFSQESDEFIAAQAPSGDYGDPALTCRQLADRDHRTMMVTMTTVSFYFITAYTPTFGTAVLHLKQMDSLVVTLCVGASNFFWLPVMGALSDRIGRRPLLIACTVLALAHRLSSLVMADRSAIVREATDPGALAFFPLWQL